jgi:hypothetical protein
MASNFAAPCAVGVSISTNRFSATADTVSLFEVMSPVLVAGVIVVRALNLGRLE